MITRQDAQNLQHPEITCIERTGYPSWMQGKKVPDFDEDAAFEEQREERGAEE